MHSSEYIIFQILKFDSWKILQVLIVVKLVNNFVDLKCLDHSFFFGIAGLWILLWVSYGLI